MNERVATRIIFFIAGMVTAIWAVIVPFAKVNTGVDEAVLGSLLLCLGAGAIVAMPLTGSLTSRFGCRKVIGCAVMIVILATPFLSVIRDPLALGLTLLIFGIGIGITDCAMNIQAIIVEKTSGKPLMSGFHGMYSVGGIAGAGLMTALLTLGLTVMLSVAALSILVLGLLVISYRTLLPYANPPEGPAFAIPRGTVLILGVICFVVFLAEGTVLDWSALYLVENRGVAESSGGLGFAVFAAAMTLGRLSGDYIISRLGSLTVVLVGALVAIAGFMVVIISSGLPALLAGYLLVGIGCANIVPVMFSQTGKQNSMPQMVAVPAVTTLGYIGVLAGPAMIGYIAHHSSLPHAFIFVMLLMLLAALLSLSLRKVFARSVVS
ncbi:fucose permease [Enterobacter sp. BIGb0383]|uniref:MFS transporter n=1 Tax=unclassified Enterobacter TaxID=2608935 RepID=UPI000F4767B8|nr:MULTISPECIES: MFS transporter [unclassified Enterobacter]ROP62006.1 fucose permease [Enterobacter sp. BIGb0383]ROS12167.1 fucose permease [Enterobacter sp. BIGb0359]